MTFIEAVKAEHDGKIVSRDGWAPGVVALVRGGQLLVRSIDGFDVPYEPTEADVLATDWGFGDAALRRS